MSGDNKYKKYYLICRVGAICEGGLVGVEYNDKYGDIKEKLSMGELGEYINMGALSISRLGTHRLLSRNIYLLLSTLFLFKCQGHEWRAPSCHLYNILTNYYSSVSQNKHQILFQPPYHPELNLIEICWGPYIYRDYPVIDPDQICRYDLPKRFLQIAPAMIKKLYKRLDQSFLHRKSWSKGRLT